MKAKGIERSVTGNHRLWGKRKSMNELSFPPYLLPLTSSEPQAVSLAEGEVGGGDKDIGNRSSWESLARSLPSLPSTSSQGCASLLNGPSPGFLHAPLQLLRRLRYGERSEGNERLEAERQELYHRNRGPFLGPEWERRKANEGNEWHAFHLSNSWSTAYDSLFTLG